MNDYFNKKLIDTMNKFIELMEKFIEESNKRIYHCLEDLKLVTQP